jgi:DNA-binding CsgD family transcriptional regulator
MESMIARETRLGELLVREGLISEQQLKEALHHQETRTPHKPLGEVCVGLGFVSTSILKGVIEKYQKQILLGALLLRMGIISVGQAHAALSEQKKIGKRVGQILLDKRSITKAELAEALSIQLGISKIVPSVYMVDPLLLAKVTPAFFFRNRVVPLSRVTSCERNKEIVTVLMEDPLDITTIVDLRKTFNAEIQPAVSATLDLEDFLNEIFDPWGHYRAVHEAIVKKDGSADTRRVDDGYRAGADDGLYEKYVQGRDRPIIIDNREKQVILMASEGSAIKEIASRLSMSPSTVKAHLDNIYRKVGVRRRRYLTTLAAEILWP